MAAHLIVLANEKGGSGKSTTAVHVAVALAHAGYRVAALDLDARQQTLARYFENRATYAAKRDVALPMADIAVLDDDGELPAALAAWADHDFVIIDTPGRDSRLGRAAMARADTLITPLNDSFIDFDLIGHVDPETYAVTKPSFYAELVWAARKQRARADGGTVDWLVVRNRLSSLEARNMRRVGAALAALSKRIGFRTAAGLSERVIYRELFPRGLTLLDVAALEDFSLSHVTARAELRALVAALGLPGVGAVADAA